MGEIGENDLLGQLFSYYPKLGVPRPLSGCPRLILANTLISSETQHINTRPRSIRPMLAVFNEDIETGVGGHTRAKLAISLHYRIIWYAY